MDTDRLRDARANQLPDLGPVLDALTVGVRAPAVYDVIFALLLPSAAIGIPPLPYPTHLLLLMRQTFAREQTESQRTSLDNETTDSALALLSGGVQFDPHDLITRTVDNTTTLAFNQSSVLSLPFAAAVLSLGLVPVPDVGIRELQNDTLGDRYERRTTHAVHIDTESALLALAMKQQGLAVVGDDIVDRTNIVQTDHPEESERTLGRNNVISALVLGMPETDPQTVGAT